MLARLIDQPPEWRCLWRIRTNDIDDVHSWDSSSLLSFLERYSLTVQRRSTVASRRRSSSLSWPSYACTTNVSGFRYQTYRPRDVWRRRSMSVPAMGVNRAIHLVSGEGVSAIAN